MFNQADYTKVRDESVAFIVRTLMFEQVLNVLKIN